MRKINHIGSLLLASSLFLVSCSREKTDKTDSNELRVADNFDYATTSEIAVDFTIANKDNTPQRGVRFDIYSPDSKRKIASGASDANGDFKTVLRVPNYFEELYVVVQRLGVDKRHVPIQNKMAVADFGGADEPRGKRKSAGTQAITPAGGNWYYLGTHSSVGVPNFLEVPGDVVDAQFITDVSSTLPETFNIPANKPALLAGSNDFDIHMQATGEVWITYISEGAGQKNSFGYFVYNTNSPPTAANQIDSIFTVFPNSSNSGSGGGLQAGDKVYLGEFQAGTSIGWVLLANGWNSTTQTIKSSNPSQTRLYSIDDLNTFTGNISKRRHNIQLLDRGRELIIVGFEDVRRDFSSDEDFNDVLFYATVTPFSSAFVDNIPETEYCNADDDNDGVLNCDEDYRFDIERAYDNVVTGTLAYEDLWPGKGDYDFNDLVMGYSTNYVTNAANNVVDIKSNYTVNAVGASFHHGFGVEVEGLSSGNVASATGSQITQGIASLNNGLESGQTDAVIIAYDDVFDHIAPASGEPYVNTVPGSSTISPVSFQLDMTLTSPVTVASIGLPPYNPFIFVRGERGREIHLADMEPTDLVNAGFFGTLEDDSDGSTRFYKTNSNLPWSIHIDGTFDYPQEYADITTAYLKFAAWASSGGANFADWYLDQSGYRNATNIY